MAWERSTFVFISTNTSHSNGGVEETWLAVMAQLVRLGASVQFICISDSPLAPHARSLGVTVAPYILDRWNVVRSRSRLRKYLLRYDPVVAHSTGTEADLLLRWAVRPLPSVAIATTLTVAEAQATRRRRPLDSLMRRFDETAIARTNAVFVPSEDLVGEVQAAGVAVERIVLDPPSDDPTASVERHLAVYREFMARRGEGG
ncbi:MAG: glycosyltransferase [Coriobacteriia bacterium]|nr:glycosyltransferase [Coriobacteriia bacterium]